MLEEIKTIEFHDCGLLELILDFSSSILKLSIEEDVDKPKKQLIFFDVNDLNMEKIEKFRSVENIEIYSAEFLENEEFFQGKFILLLDEGPSCELRFSFRSVRLIK